MRRLLVASVVLLPLWGPGCSRVPVAPPTLPPPVTRLYAKDFPVVWDTVRVDLNNVPGLEVDTIDKGGRFVAWERTNALFLLLSERNVVTVRLESVGEDHTRMALQMSAQKYDTGGWTRPAGWYPSTDIDVAMGQRIVASIDRRLGHVPGPADTLPLPGAPAPAAAEPGAAPAPAPVATSPAPERRGWRRFLPRWPWDRRS